MRNQKHTRKDLLYLYNLYRPIWGKINRYAQKIAVIWKIFGEAQDIFMRGNPDLLVKQEE